MDVQEAEEKKSLNTPGGDEFLVRVGGKGQGVPFFAFLDSGGGLIVNAIAPQRADHAAGNIGHPYEPHEVDWFMVMLSKAAPGMTADERSTIEKWLRAQKKQAPAAAH
jgi:hypothetical protein